ncbi:hypothetical protein [Vibrio fortis]|uniref:hypothetical protein n=1 Tax=Vibrio fortis TaxID=212667 RepID=UPI0021C2B280|nr:hypothetical protein [Vibrio fortis]
MKKVSLLAASVAFALTGCGSDSDSSGAAPGGVVITGFDGYFNQAIAFQDTNNNGQLDINTLGTEGADLVFGLTDTNGQITVPSSIEGALALQTLTPGGTVQQALIAHNNDEFEVAGKYTIDMDHPSQAMAHELVFRAPTSSKVISPITDLVAIEAEKNGGDLEAAETAVNVALGGTDSEPVALYDDFVEGDDADAELHKTAQILTESKAANPATYEDKANQFANKADDVVDGMSPADLENNNVKPVIIDNGTGEALDPVIVTNEKLVVNTSIYDTAQTEIDELDLQVGDPLTEEFISLSNTQGNLLFSDADLTEGTNVDVTILENAALKEAGISVQLSGNSLMIYSKGVEILKSGNFAIELQAFDTNSEGEVSQNPTSAIFTLTIASENSLPTVTPGADTALQNEIDSDWSFQVGTPISNMTLDITNLFTDEEGNKIQFGTKPRLSTAYLESGIEATYSDDFTTITLSGTPTKVANKGTLSIDATDEFHSEGEWETVTLNLPEIEEGASPEPTPGEHVLEDQFLHFVEHGDGDRDYMSAWCDTVYLDSKTKVMYWNIRNDNNNWECTSEDLSLFEAGPTYTVNADKTISFDGMTLDVISEDIYGDNLDHYFVSLDENGDTELYSYYQNAVAVENMIYQPVIEAGWKTRIVHTYVEGNAQELDVSAVVQEHSESYVAAEIHIGDMSCDQFEAIYPGHNMYVSASNGQGFWNLSVIDDLKDPEQPGCYIKRKPNSGEALEPGLFSIQFKADSSDEAETIVFSFNKE